ncbi:MAG: hypothetical protein IPK76_07255 [Lewinellaceae bacterium]|nr:hypothetical protein [Lewinellaceae bacterium]
MQILMQKRARVAIPAADQLRLYRRQPERHHRRYAVFFPVVDIISALSLGPDGLVRRLRCALSGEVTVGRWWRVSLCTFACCTALSGRWLTSSILLQSA